MPSLKKLSIESFRNLRTALIEPGEAINLIVGVNGSGKTSLLESISVLAHGRSFRTHKYRRLINHDGSQFTIFGLVQDEDEQPFEHRMGVVRSSNGKFAIKIDGLPVHTSAELAQRLPLLVLNANSFQLLEGASRYRRQFFDWLVFHVKHDYKNCWKAYSKCIKHRNSLLRSGKIASSEIAPWNREIAQVAEGLEQMRSEVFTPFKQAFHSALADFVFSDGGQSVDIQYVSGWKEGANYLEQLEQSEEKDLRLGYTSIGSHRSDLKINAGKSPAVELLSRGQQKSVIVSMFLAEASVFHQLTEKKPVFLLDDLPSELDLSNLKVIGNAIQALESQVFVTAIDSRAITECWNGPVLDDLKMFHVKHGEIHDFT